MSGNIDWRDALLQVQRLHVGGANCYHDWLSLASSLKAATAGDNWYIFLEISRNSEHYKNDEDCAKLWRYARAHNNTAFAIGFLHRRGVIFHDVGDRFCANSVYFPTPQPPIEYARTPISAELTRSKLTIDLDRTNYYQRNVKNSTLYRHIKAATFGHDCHHQVNDVFDAYKMGANSKGAAVFTAMNSSGEACWQKVIYYGDDGHRRHDRPTYIAGNINCFFGEHLITENESKTIAVVESEKSAIWGAIFMPDFLWLATGGANNLNRIAYRIDGRDVVLFADADEAGDNWSSIATQHRWRITSPAAIGGAKKSDIADVIESDLQSMHRDEIDTLVEMSHHDPIMNDILTAFRLSVSTEN